MISRSQYISYMWLQVQVSERAYGKAEKTDTIQVSPTACAVAYIHQIKSADEAPSAYSSLTHQYAFKLIDLKLHCKRKRSAHVHATYSIINIERGQCYSRTHNFDPIRQSYFLGSIRNCKLIRIPKMIELNDVGPFLLEYVKQKNGVNMDNVLIMYSVQLRGRTNDPARHGVTLLAWLQRGRYQLSMKAGRGLTRHIR